MNADKKHKPCLISCSVLKDEIHELQRRGELNADVIFVSKYFHIDYDLLKKNLRATIERTLKRFGKPVVVYGDLCLGPNGEMKQLMSEYGLIKVDALNCVDCLLGGHGQIEGADPNHELMFFDPGMIDFFFGAQKKLKQEGLSEEDMRNMFSGIKGIVLLDTLGNAEKCVEDIGKLKTGLEILEIKEVGVDNLKLVLSDAIKRSEKAES